MHRLHHMHRCFAGPFGPLTGHSLLILTIDVRSRMLANDRAATHMCRRRIGCVRTVDVGLLAGPWPTMVVGLMLMRLVIDDEVKTAGVKKKTYQIWANTVENVLIPTR